MVLLFGSVFVPKSCKRFKLIVSGGAGVGVDADTGAIIKVELRLWVFAMTIKEN